MIATRVEDQILIRSARRSLGVETEQLSAVLGSDVDWANLLRLAERHCIVPLLYKQIESLNIDPIPADALAKLQAANQENTHTNLFLTGELIKLLDSLDASGILAIPLKGPTLAVQAYGDIGLRQFSDLDILVRQSDVSRIQSLLSESGFTPHHRLTSAQQAALKRFDCSCNFISKHGVALDVHWGLVDRHHGFAIDTERFFERLDLVTVNGRELRTLATEPLLLFLCLHGFTHFWERLSWICDVAALVTSGKEIDWKLALLTAKASGALRILLLGLWLAHDVFLAPLPEEVLSAVLKDPVVQQVAHEVEQQLFAEVGIPTGIFSEATLLLRLRERKRDQLKSLLSLLWAPRRYDRLFVTLPESLTFLYYLVRPARLAAKYGTQIFRSPNS